MDDIATGGGSGAEMGKSSASEADNTGPLEKRLVSKNWSVRANAFEELTNMCKDPSVNSAKIQEYASEFKTYLKDSNPGALEKALICLEFFLQKIKGPVMAEHQNDLLNIITDKCLGHAKPTIKAKANECVFAMFDSTEAFTEAQDALLGLAANKNIKIMTCGTQLIAGLLEAYGLKKIQFNVYNEQMIKNAQNTNPQCKTAAYEFYKALYKWKGEGIMVILEEKLKKQQVDDLKKLFEEVKTQWEGKKKDIRMTMKEAKEAESRKKDDAIEQSIKQEEEVVDKLEFAPVFNPLDKYNVEWQDATAALTKWQDKVEKLTELATAMDNKKIKSGNYEGMCLFLKKETGAVNVNTSLAAVKCSTSLCNGLRKDFGPYLKTLMGVTLTKYKEKGQRVSEELQKFFDATLQCTNLEEIKDEIIPQITNVAPTVKTGTIKYIEKMAITSYIDVLQKVENDLLPVMVKALDDKDAGVRETALHCMGILKGRYSEATIAKYLKDVIPQKMAKIDEAAKEIQPSKYDRPENWKPPAPKKVAPKKEETLGDDDLNDVAPPKKGPPKGLGQKPPSKKKPAEDVEMKDEEKEVKQGLTVPELPKKGPPALGQKPPGASDKPKLTVPTKAPTGPKIVEEDLGAGISKEDALAKCQDFYNPGTIKAFEEAKWQDKVEGFNKLQEEIKEKQPSAQMMEATSRFIKTMMKDWKESNINLQKGIVATYLVMARDADTMSKKTIKTGMEFIVDKLGDVKMLVQTKELLMYASEVVTPRYIALQVVKYAAAAKAPKCIEESSKQLAEMLDEFGPLGWPLQETIDFGKVACNHATPAVRQAAMKLFSILFQHVGEPLRNFLTEIKESTLKLIEAEFAKITPYKRGEFEKKRSCRGEAAAEEEAMMGAAAKKGGKGGAGGGGGGDLLSNLPRQDISKQLNTKLLEQFKNKDWKIRVKVAEEVEALLRDAKMRIEANGLGELMDALKNGMKDSNKAVVKKYIQLLGTMAEAIGPEVKQFIKKCFVPMLNNLSDKQSLVRADVIASVDKWAEQIGPEQVVTQIGAAIALENPEMRSEGIKWILDHQDSIKDADCVSIVKPLVSCLIDKVKDIRDKTEQICLILMPISGYSEFQDAIKDFKPAVQQTLKPVIEKIKSQCGAGQKGGAPVAAPKVEEKKAAAPEKKEAPGSFQKAAEAKQAVKKAEPEKEEPQKKQSTTTTASKGKNVDDDNEYNVVGTAAAKAKRALNDSRTKFPVGEVKGDHIELLQNQCTTAFGQKFSDLMFAKAVDFNKHIGCCKQLEKFINSHPSELLEVLDILFKWGSLRMTESSNTQLLMSIFDFYTALLNFLTENGTKLQEFEALVLIGQLGEKCGHNIKQMAEKSRKLLKQCYDVYEPKQLYRILVDQGLKNKNLKVVSESLEEIADYITGNGVDSVTKKDFTFFLAAVDSPDKGVRESSLKVYGEIYTLIGEDVWRLQPKDIPLKVKGLLEQRFKSVSKKGGLSASINNLNMASTLKGKQADTLSATQTNSSAKPSRQSVIVPQTVGFKSSKPPIANDNFSEEKQLTPKVNKKEDVEMVEDEPEVSEDIQENSITNKIEKMQLNDRQNQKNRMPMDDESAQAFGGKKKMANSPPQKHEEMEQEVSPQQKKKQIPQPDLQMQEDDEAIEIRQTTKKQKELRHSVNLDEVLNQAEDRLIIDPESAKHRSIILGHIEALKVGDMMKRINCLIALNDIISATGEATSEETQPQSVNQSPESQMQLKAMIRCCDQLIQAYTEVMIDLFNIPITEIPLRFTKYFITIVNKTCCAKNIMREVSQKQVLGLVEQLLTRLLIENLDKIGKEKEGELIMKNLNASMLRMLENCNHTHIFVVLFSLLIKYKDDASQPKVVSLIIKCLLKLSKNMEKLIDKVNLSKLLVAIHEYLCSMPTEKRTQNDDLGTRIAKTLINDIVRLKPSEIWRHYESVKNHHQQDKHVEKWIQIVLKGLPSNPGETPRGTEQTNRNQGYGGDSNSQQLPQENKSKMYQEFEMKKILQDLKKGTQSDYESGIQRLDKFTKVNPLYDYQKALNKEGENFAAQVNGDLNKFRNGNSRISTNNTDSLGGRQELNTSNSKNVFTSKRMSNVASQSQLIGLQSNQNDLNKSLKQDAFKSKLAQLNSRQSNVNPSQTLTNNVPTQAQVQQNLNSSFSELNANLANKWAQINNSNSKKFGGATGRPMTAQNGGPLVNTMRASVGIPGPGPIGGTLLNTSNNQFKSRLGGGFAARVQTKQGENNSSLGGAGQVDNVNTSIGNLSQNNSQLQNNISGQNTSANAGGGISSNSFRTRLIGLKQTRQTETNEPTEQLTTSGGMPSGVGVSGSSATLQKKLADMKAKLSSVKKQ